jgi:hypothetical protein
MAYTIIKSDGTILTTIADGTINTTSTSLGLPSRNFSGYGKALDTNFVHHLENFASTSPPLNPLRGQLWYNTNTQTMYICPSDRETNVANWLALATTSSGGTTSFSSVNVQGNLQANIITAVTSVSASTGIFTNISVSSNITGSNANIGNLSSNVFTSNSLRVSGNASAGRLGIGTNNPLELLHVINSANTTGYDDSILFVTTNNANGSQYSRMLIGQNTTNNLFIEVADATNVKGNLLLQPFGGTVSINTLSTTNTLNVGGNASFSGNVTATNFVGNLDTTGSLYTRGAFGMRSALIAGNPIMYDVQDQAGATVLEIGRRDNVAAITAIDIHTGANSTDYDTRLEFTGGTGAPGQGVMTISAASVFLPSTGATCTVSINTLSTTNTLNVGGSASFSGNVTATNFVGNLVAAGGNIGGGNLNITGSVTASSVNTQNTFGFKNRIINGSMLIDQRLMGASVSPVDGQFTLDRWRAFLTQSNRYNIQRNAGSITPPPGFTSYLGATSLSAYSSISSDYFGVAQMIEYIHTPDLLWGSISAKPVSLSFWTRSSLTGIFGGSIRNGLLNRAYIFSYTINVANTWEYKTITIPGETTGVWIDVTGAKGIQCWFDLGSGSVQTAAPGTWIGGGLRPTGSQSLVGTNGATWYVTGVQLEVGSMATSFDIKDYGRELTMCHRYFYSTVPFQMALTVQKTNNSSSYNGSITTFSLPAMMHASPTLTVYSSSARANPGNVLVNGITLSTGYAFITYPTMVQLWSNPPTLSNVGDYYLAYCDFDAEIR